MTEPFIRNHQYNFMKKHVDKLQKACQAATDPKVVEAIRSSAIFEILEQFPSAADSQKALVDRIAELRSAEDCRKYLSELEPYMLEFPRIPEKQIQKLFPKVKKLKAPDLASIDYRYVTYLSWIDIATNKLFMVYNRDGQWIGIEGRNTPTNKKGYCCLCNRSGELSLVTAITKTKPANASPDYYKAVGNYMCTNSEACNKNISDETNLERFIHHVIG
ncbi:Fibronectin-binding family protein [Paenibacillus curdlanolyticus YK9]|uniref:Fibronectin-binding family protein n=1 Tax=Paenibacillus curdlanolyticus YK9 TaxID=717606 RepID=E0IAC0_9BACL|nr:elongation factor G-binding protein [Paenibacillus curdlanolyticus]EFM10697.1 Fibronectin-binding family protein [Paenibacillus curdlanolyticus YK9]